MSSNGRLAADRAARDDAKIAFANRLEQVREDLEARGIGGRIADKVAADAANAASEVADVVRSNKPVVAGTLVALIAWIFRNPILGLFDRLTGESSGDGETEDDAEKELNS